MTSLLTLLSLLKKRAPLRPAHSRENRRTASPLQLRMFLQTSQDLPGIREGLAWLGAEGAIFRLDSFNQGLDDSVNGIGKVVFVDVAFGRRGEQVVADVSGGFGCR